MRGGPHRDSDIEQGPEEAKRQRLGIGGKVRQRHWNVPPLGKDQERLHYCSMLGTQHIVGAQ